ncbi:MAG: DUF255 domain-containing protein [Planctomycetota bacterium]|nr:DUF255 domain-containing protein [Planctomycetota bacterium]
MPQALRTRRALPLALLLVTALTLSTGVEGADASPGVHPTMGNTTLSWHTRLTEAQADARAKGKLLFVEVSRAPSRCMKCRVLFNSVLNTGDIGRRMDAIAVGVHFDWRGVDRTVYRRIQRNLRNQNVDPTVAFLTPDLGFVSGYAPGRNDRSSTMRVHLERAVRTAERKHKSMTKPSGPSDIEPHPDVADEPEPKPILPPNQPRPGPARFVWYRNIREAQNAAREQGKILMLVSTKPNCGLCRKLKDQVIPSCRADIAKGAVAYLYDITRPESREVDRLVRGMNRGARLMPLCGFATADLKPLKGFSGPTTATQLRGYMRQAQRMSGGR